MAGTLPAALPPGRRLQTAFASRVQALPASVYDLLLLAVLDGTGDLRLIRALAADRAGQGLESAERAGLVRADESTARLTFRSSPRERYPPTSTRSSPNSASPPAPPSATHSPIRLPNETAAQRSDDGDGAGPRARSAMAGAISASS